MIWPPRADQDAEYPKQIPSKLLGLWKVGHVEQSVDILADLETPWRQDCPSAHPISCVWIPMLYYTVLLAFPTV